MEVEEIYSEIGNSIVDSISDEWSKAWIEAEMEDDNGKLVCRFTSDSEKEEQYTTTSKTFDLFDELRNHCNIEKNKLASNKLGKFSLKE